MANKSTLRDFEIGEHLITDKLDVYITDKKREFIKGRGNALVHRYKCNKCGYDCSDGYRNGNVVSGKWYEKSDLLRRSCACCENKIIVPNINSIAVKMPELSVYFLNGEEYMYSPLSNTKTKLRCPYCGTEKSMTISSLTRQGFACPVCSVKTSIGERIVFNMLSSIGADFKKEYMFDGYDYRYDFYLPDFNTIIEVHGRQHYQDSGFSQYDDVHQNDICKIELADQFGISKYIVIDARKSDFDFIRKNIIESELSDIFDLSLVDWESIEQNVFHNQVVTDICKYWDKHPETSYASMEKIFGYSESMLRKYINAGYKAGLCSRNASFQRKTEFSYNPVYYISNDTYFRTVGLCAKYLGKTHSSISYKISRGNPDFKRITKEEFNKAIQDGLTCIGEPFLL